MCVCGREGGASEVRGFARGRYPANTVSTKEASHIFGTTPKFTQPGDTITSDINAFHITHINPP